MRMRIGRRGVLRFVLSVPVALALVTALATTGADTTCQPQFSFSCNGPSGGGGGDTPTPVPTATNTPVPTPTPVRLQSCITENAQHRCYAFARATGLSIDGAQATYDAEQYAPPDWASGGASRQVVWMGDGAGNWCEVGWKRGGWDNLQQFTDPFNVYSAYMLSGRYVESDMSFGPGAFGTTHTYKVARDAGTGVAQAYVDSVVIASCAVTVPSTHMDVGLEYTDENAVNEGVSPYNLQVRDYVDYNNVSATWSTWSSEGGLRGDCVFGPGSFMAWSIQDQQFTDSSNVVPGNENNSCP